MNIIESMKKSIEEKKAVVALFENHKCKGILGRAVDAQIEETKAEIARLEKSVENFEKILNSH
jgi:ferritin-like metal-binding protein YciE